MRTSLVFMKAVARISFAATGAGPLAIALAESLPEIVDGIWSAWATGRPERDLKAEIEHIASAPASEIEAEARKAIEEVAPSATEEAKQEVYDYLRQVPFAIRQRTRRISDPRGVTLPTRLVLRRSVDLLPLLPAKPSRFHPGDRPIQGIDWELVELIGVGGFGEVWRAKHTHFEDHPHAALKFCLDPDAQERLLKHEAGICYRVQHQANHPGIVQLQQTYLSANPPCLQYEYVDGGDLAGLINDWPAETGPARHRKAADLILQISQIVGFAHRLSPPIVHRDLKPANVLLHRDEKTREVSVKIADYGIGQLAIHDDGRTVLAKSHQAARFTTAILGSYSELYASPEQIRGESAVPSDDVHAIGVIWYQMLTGDLTLGRPSGSAWKRRLSTEGVTEEMVDLLESCFEDRSYRLKNATVLSTKLERLATMIWPRSTAREAHQTIEARENPPDVWPRLILPAFLRSKKFE